MTKVAAACFLSHSLRFSYTLSFSMHTPTISRRCFFSHWIGLF